MEIIKHSGWNIPLYKESKMENEIYIKAWFSDWKKVSLKKAIHFFNNYKNARTQEIVKRRFNEHFRGITYEEIIKAVEEQENDH